jgi:hypothetical protein
VGVITLGERRLSRLTVGCPRPTFDSRHVGYRIVHPPIS